MENEEIEKEGEKEVDESYQKKVDGVLVLMQGCLDILFHNCRVTLNKTGKDFFKGEMRLDHESTTLDYFNEINKNVWSVDVKQMMTLEISDHLLKEYREHNLPVDTLIVKIGDTIIGRSMLPSGGKC